jgi:putative polyhydroxyalkanoate system protein
VFLPGKGGKRAVLGILRYAADMADIHVERAHGIGKEAALKAALRVAERMKEKAQVNYRVNGDVIEFERTGAKGRLTVTDDRVIADVTLGLMLKPMRGLVEGKIDEYFTRYFV